MPHLHWVIWAYAKHSGADYEDTTYIDLVAETYQEAIKRVEKIFPLTLKGGSRKGAGYRIHQVIEHVGDTCK